MATEEIEISQLELAEDLAPDMVLPVETITDTKATTLQKIKEWLGIESAILKQVPRGVVFPFGGSVAPDGFLICDGSAISRTTYADLFAVIGTTYGAGDGSTTFNLPNYSSARMITSSNVPVKGTGITLGWTDGSTNYGTRAWYSATRNTFPTNAYGKAVGGSASGEANIDKIVGITKDSSKSGITGTASLASSCKFIIKY